MLPVPTTSRFQPLRCGLINLFKYQDQEFWYERGRLLIRGNNGTGKSRVLALQLPFLFDGEISPRRVEPDGDPARQIAWHLLMDEHEQRTGYTWIEFGRRDETGAEHYLTMGCGMRAIRGGDNQPTRWYFVTDRRAGKDFHLLDGAHPLSAERLSEALGSECLFKTARDYRQEIDRRLFCLGPERYAALLELLIRLRAPQLSKKLEEKALFAALSDALPPLPEEVVRNVAEAFKQLDDLRGQFSSLEKLFQSLAAFQSGYQTYLQTAILRSAERVRSGHSQYEAAQRRVNEIERQTEEAQSQKERTASAVNDAQNCYTEADARFEALQSSTAAGDAVRLDESKRLADEREVLSSQAKIRADETENRAEEARHEWEQQTSNHENCTVERNQALSGALETARRAGFASEFAGVFPDAPVWPERTDALTKLKSAVERMAGDHLHRLDQIDAGLSKLKEAEEAVKTAQRAEDAADGTVKSLHEEVNHRDRQAREASAALAIAYANWQSGLRYLPAPFWSELAPAFEEWLETANDGHRILTTELSEALSREVSGLATERAGLKAQHERAAAERRTLIAERESLANTPPPPAAPETRDQSSRDQRAGAPLWRLCEFHPGLSAGECAGLEAALEAAGLLDAWVMPDGTLSGSFPCDTFLDGTVALHGANVAEQTLVAWLIPDPSMTSAVVPGIDADTLRRVLLRIGAGAGQSPHWVSLDGRWQLGPVFGRGAKNRAEHLGASSREAARQRRLAEIEKGLDALRQQETALEKASAQIDEREATARAERTSAPGDADIAEQLTLRTNARLKLNDASAEHSLAVQETWRARENRRTVDETLRRDALDLGYREHLERLAELRPAWGPFELALTKLWAQTDKWITSAQHLQRLTQRQVMYQEDAIKESGLAREAETAARHAENVFKTLRETLGSSVSEFQAQLQCARDARKSAQKALDNARDAAAAAGQQIAALEVSREAAVIKVAEASTIREEAIRELRVPLVHGLFPEAHASFADVETEEWSPTRAAVIARRIHKELPDLNLSDDAWTARLNLLNTQITELRNNTGTACEIESQLLSEGLTMVVCRYQGLRLKPAECLAAVAGEREIHERLLNQGERDIIDRHLIAEVSMQLQSLMENAQHRTTQMNDEMTRCATTLGVTLRLKWEPLTEGMPPGMAAVRELLRAYHDAWSPEERTAVGQFLHQLIQNERTANPAAPATEQLLRALDYRQWHAFYAERRQNERWERLTRKRYGTGSGGEKALMLTIPQMAAAASHYRTAAPHAPRFILLDEAFAGLDAPTRSRLMGLLEAFDLDLLMTSEREWGTHATVPGIAIYQLVADADAVAATRWVWNGRSKALAPVPDTPELRLFDPS